MTTNTLPWTPPATGVHLLPAGRWWDAVQVLAPLSEDVLHLLDENTGAVIEDPQGRALWWLIEPGAAVHWDPHPSVKVYGNTAYIEVPGTEDTVETGVQWWVQPSTGYLTSASALGFALQVASRKRGRQ